MLIVGALLGLVVWFTWPVLAGFGRLQVGSLFPYDQYLSVYLLEWGHHVLWSDPGQIFDAPICYPEPLALASTEHLIGFAPLYAVARLGHDEPLIAYHAVLITVFLLNGLAMAALVRSWTKDDLAAIAAGACFAFAPCLFTFGAWIHVVSLFCLPLLLLGLDETMWGRGRRGPVILAFAVFVQVSLTVYGNAYGSIMGASFLLAQLAVSRGSVPWRRLWWVAGAVSINLPLLILIAHPYVIASPLAGGGYEGLGTRIVQQSAGMIPFDPLASGAALWSRLGHATGVWRASTFILDAGRVTLLLAVVGVVITMRTESTALRRRVAGLVAVIVTGILLALGPGFIQTPLGGLPLPLVLLDELPVFGGLRFAERFIVLAAIGLAACAGIGFSLLLGGRPVWLRWTALLVLVALIHWDGRGFEVRPAAPLGPPTASASWLRESGAGAPLLEWPPLTTGCQAVFHDENTHHDVEGLRASSFLRTLRCFDAAAQRTLENAWHWQPTTLCFTSHPPERNADLAYALLSATDPEDFAALIEHAGIERLLVHQDPPTSAALGAAGFRRVSSDGPGALYVREPAHDGIRSTGQLDPAASAVRVVSIESPSYAEPGARVIGTVQVGRGTQGAVGDREPALAVWVGWRDTDGNPALAFSAERLARLEALPTRWNRALTAAYMRPARLGTALAPPAGVTRSVPFAITAPEIPGHYRLTATTGPDGRAIEVAEVEIEVRAP